MQNLPIPLLILTILLLVWMLGLFLALWHQHKHRVKKHPELSRHPSNPIISPRSEYAWESNSTFNPAIIEDDEGNIHMFYRAIGSDGLSRLGYALSSDGLRFEKRSPYPVYQSTRTSDMNNRRPKSERSYNPAFYTSGGGWGGTEDPRAVRIGDRVYMTYVAFEGWNSVRIALTSIALDDLKNERWNWKRPTLISAPEEVHKNWVVFPEKIKGKFAILHGLSPEVRIEYVDSLDEMHTAPYIKSAPNHGGRGYEDPTRKDYWDNFVRGVGPPPVKTPYGWLVLYHGYHPHKYVVGAMILDLADPTKILYRSSEPILEPLMHYENDGKPGVVYASGMVIKDDTLYVYYGGGDKIVAVATIPLKPFLKHLSQSPV